MLCGVGVFALAGLIASCGLEPSPAAKRQPGADGDTVAYFDPALTESFFDFPWPSDLRVDEEGHADMTGFPNPENVAILDLYLETMEEDIVGFGNNSPAYFRFTADIDTGRLPQLPWDTLGLGSNVFLVNVDRDSAAYGERLPALTGYYSEAYTYSPSHLLGVSPKWGFPMLPRTTYAAVVLKELRDVGGHRLGAPAELERLLSGDAPQDPALGVLSESFDALADYLDAAGIDRGEVAAATVFTTQDPVSELGAIRDYIHTEMPEPTLDPGLEQPIWYVEEDPDYEKVNEEEELLYPTEDTDPYDTKDSTSKDYWQFEGYYQGPNFQEGEPPYAETGGAITYDENGDPIYRLEPLRFCLAVPKGEPPEGGWPIAIFAHGTGGNYKNLLYSGTYTVAGMLIPRGIAVIGIDEPLHGERAPEGTDPDLMSFNFLNPDAARANFRQAAIDVFYLSWLVRTSLYVPADVSPTGAEVRFDPNRVSFVGHSHGGLSGSLLTPFETDLTGSVLSGAGGGLSLTILLRKDYVDFEALMRAMLMMPDTDPLDTFHPVMAIIQDLVDVTDPLNYSPLFAARPVSGRAANVLQTEGFFDEACPPPTIEALAVAGQLPILEPVGRNLEGLELMGVAPVPRPTSGNVKGPDGKQVTMAIAQFPEDNHYAIHRDYEAARLYADFIQSISYTGAAVLK